MVVEPFTLDGRPVRSSEIRTAVVAGDLGRAAALLGRPVTLTGAVEPGGPNGRRLAFDLPIALPPDGDYRVDLDGTPITLRIVRGDAYLRGEISNRRVKVVLGAA